MNRIQIKELAKSKIKGNKWNILWPLLIISVIETILFRLFGPKIDYTNLESITNITPSANDGIMFVINILIGIITAGYMMYILNFVRKGEFNSDAIINTVKEKWLNILIAEILTSIIIGICAMLLVIPGIIMALAYAMVTFIIIDTDKSAVDAMKASREMMKGHKWEFFVFGLSFIGWALLVPFTLGLLLIWLIPYIMVATTIYYDNLSK